MFQWLTRHHPLCNPGEPPYLGYPHFVSMAHSPSPSVQPGGARLRAQPGHVSMAHSPSPSVQPDSGKASNSRDMFQWLTRHHPLCNPVSIMCIMHTLVCFNGSLAITLCATPVASGERPPRPVSMAHSPSPSVQR